MDIETEVKSINAKLDTILYGQATTDTRLKSVEENVKELNRTVRGSNGDKGLVAEVYLLTKRIEEFVASASKEREEVKEERRLDRIESQEKDRESKRENDDDFITWKWLIEKAGMPVAIAFILWLLLTVLPKLTGLLNL